MLLLGAALLPLSFGVSANEGPHHYDYINLNSYASYYVDKGKSDNLDDALRQRGWIRNTSGRVLNFGFSKFAVWLRVQIDLDEYDAEDWYLAMPYPLLESVDVYLLRPGSRNVIWQSTLADARHDANAFRSHNVDFSLPQDLSGEITLLIRVQSTTSMQIPLELWSVQYLVSRQNMEALIWGTIFGVILAFMAYNAFLYFAMRDVTYGLYLLNLVSRVLLIFSISGLGARYVWHDHNLTHFITPVAACMAQFWLLCFSLRFLAGNRLRPGLAHAMRIMAVLNVIGAVYVGLWPDNGAFLVSCVGSVSLILVLVSGVSCQWAGLKIARYFVIATAAMVTGTFTYFANVFGMLEHSQFTNLALPVGSMLEALLFSLALAHRLKEERRHRLIALEKVKLAQQTIVQVQEQALVQALHDPITEFPNDALLLNRLNELVDRDSECDAFALAMIYFPDFRNISTSLGRRLSEDLFRQLSERLNEALAGEAQSLAVEKSARFYVAVPEFGSVAVLIRMGVGNRSVVDYANHILRLNENAIELEGTATRLTAQCGIAMYPKHAERADLLMQYASAARDYGARDSEPVTVYSTEIDIFGRRRVAIVGELAHAIRVRELEVYLQPQFDCLDSRVVGAEALLRWNSEKFGVVTPTEFIEVAEDVGLIAELTRYVIDESFRLLHSFNEIGQHLTLSINLSVLNLLDPKLVTYITAMAEVHHINLKEVVLEITETSSSNNFETLVENINQLSAVGCSIALDDYGTGYSSLAYLSRLPIQELKIDRSFISQMTRNDSDFRIVENTVKLSRTLQLQTVAEGVEDQETLNAVIQMGCNRVQGYYLSRPMPVAQFRDWLLRRAPRALI